MFVRKQLQCLNLTETALHSIRSKVYKLATSFYLQILEVHLRFKGVLLKLLFLSTACSGFVCSQMFHTAPLEDGSILMLLFIGVSFYLSTAQGI